MPPPDPASSISGDLVLKVTPPRAPRDLLVRSALQAADRRFHDAPIVLVQAPAGFGKTSLLAQWRREHLARGAVVAWLTAQARDDGVRLVQALALAVRTAAARPTFGHVLLEGAPRDPAEGITAWLAEVAQAAFDLVLFVDDADRLEPAPLEALGYLLRNAPPNLRCVVAARTDARLDIDDLVAYGTCTVVGAAELRFTLDETLRQVRERFQGAMDRDAAARLHEMTEGWPLGLQLALSVLGSGAQAVLPDLDLHGGALRAQFVGALVSNLAPEEVAFLTRVSIADPLHPALAEELSPGDGARLERLLRETPLFATAEQGGWLRMHALAREALRQRLDALPAAERADLHARCARWLAQRGLVETAVLHASNAGQEELAFALAERSLYESMMQRGLQAALAEWVATRSEAELDGRPRLLLAAAWSCALSERHGRADHLVERVLAQPAVGEAQRWECALIRGGSAIFTDDPDRFAALQAPWAQAPAGADPHLLQVHANRTAFLTLLEGQPALARLKQQQGPREREAVSPYLQRWGDFVIALSYLWEGQVLLAEQLLRPALAAAESDLGRRDPFACMLATLLAAAVWERDAPDEAGALLANRLDVLERRGLPECVLLAYRTLGRIAAAAGQEHRALELLRAFDAVGVARQLPRLRIASLSDLVRLHARRSRADTCRTLCIQLDALMEEAGAGRGPLWRRSAGVLQHVAHAHAAIAAEDWRGALGLLQQADAVARELQQGRLHIELAGLRAYALDRCGERSARALLRETRDLAASLGLRRVFVDAHPALGAWAAEVAGADAPAAPAPAARTPGPAARPARLAATPTSALTPKEREVLELAARNLSNKEIGLALQVGEETIKWHMKNLFAKLDAGTRKQVVSRARILGLLTDAG